MEGAGHILYHSQPVIVCKLKAIFFRTMTPGLVFAVSRSYNVSRSYLDYVQNGKTTVSIL